MRHEPKGPVVLTHCLLLEQLDGNNAERFLDATRGNPGIYNLSLAEQIQWLVGYWSNAVQVTGEASSLGWVPLLCNCTNLEDFGKVFTSEVIPIIQQLNLPRI